MTHVAKILPCLLFAASIATAQDGLPAGTEPAQAQTERHGTYGQARALPNRIVNEAELQRLGLQKPGSSYTYGGQVRDDAFEVERIEIRSPDGSYTLRLRRHEAQVSVALDGDTLKASGDGEARAILANPNTELEAYLASDVRKRGPGVYTVRGWAFDGEAEPGLLLHAPRPQLLLDGLLVQVRGRDEPTWATAHYGNGVMTEPEGPGNTVVFTHKARAVEPVRGGSAASGGLRAAVASVAAESSPAARWQAMRDQGQLSAEEHAHLLAAQADLEALRALTQGQDPEVARWKQMRDQGQLTAEELELLLQMKADVATIRKLANAGS